MVDEEGNEPEHVREAVGIAWRLFMLGEDDTEEELTRPGPSLGEIMDKYIMEKTEGRSESFKRAADMAKDYMNRLDLSIFYGAKGCNINYVFEGFPSMRMGTPTGMMRVLGATMFCTKTLLEITQWRSRGKIPILTF